MADPTKDENAKELELVNKEIKKTHKERDESLKSLRQEFEQRKAKIIKDHWEHIKQLQQRKRDAEAKCVPHEDIATAPQPSNNVIGNRGEKRSHSSSGNHEDAIEKKQKMTATDDSLSNPRPESYPQQRDWYLCPENQTTTLTTNFSFAKVSVSPKTSSPYWNQGSRSLGRLHLCSCLSWKPCSLDLEIFLHGILRPSPSSHTKIY